MIFDRHRDKPGNGGYVFAPVWSYSLKVIRNPAIRETRYVDVLLDTKLPPQQIGLSFCEDAKELTLGSVFDNYVNLVMPMSMLSDILYLMAQWKQKSLELKYDVATKSVTHFNLSAVNAAPTLSQE